MKQNTALLLLALKYCIEHNYSTVSFRTDSQLVERAVEKEYAKNKIFAPLLDEALQYIKKLRSLFLLSGFQVVKIK
ncbi:reverse transcriptase-like protein [Bacillus cereus]